MPDFTPVREFEVSPAALEARIRRRLRREGERLCKTRGQRALLDLGEYYVVDYNNIIVAWHCDLERLGRELGCLADHEALQQAKGGRQHA